MGLVVKDDGWRVPDWLWAEIEPLLPERPAHPLGCHNPRVPDREAMNAILFVHRTGCQWNALNGTGICSSSSAHRRFQEWEQAGVFAELWRRGLVAYDERHGIELPVPLFDPRQRAGFNDLPLEGEKAADIVFE